MWFQSRRNKPYTELLYASYTDVGSRPGNNQDAVTALYDDEFSVFCIADGMGGHTSGELASSEIIRLIRQWKNVLRSKGQAEYQDVFDSFEKTIEEANSVIYEKYNQKSVCGSTVVALIICGHRYCIVSVGDSRCYLASGSKIRQLTRDDVWNANPKDGVNSRDNGKLLKAVGVDEDLICNRITGEICKGDSFFLCSDGIYKVLGDKYINAIPKMIRKANTSNDLETILRAMREDVDKKGAPDNNTGIFVKCV